MAQVLGSYPYSMPYYYESSAGPLPYGSVWCQAPLSAYFSDPASFVRIMQDFDQLTIASNTFGGWTFTQATSGSVAADATVPSGVIKLDAGAVTANQGVNFQLNQIPFKLHATLPTVFEARVKISQLRLQAFVGLAAIQTALITSGAVGTDDKIGFAGVSTTGVLQSNTTASSTATTGTGKTITAATYYRLGFVATTSLVTFYVDGVAVSTSTTNIPTAALSPSLVMQAHGTSQPVMSVDYIACIAPRV